MLSFNKSINEKCKETHNRQKELRNIYICEKHIIVDVTSLLSRIIIPFTKLNIITISTYRITDLQTLHLLSLFFLA